MKPRITLFLLAALLASCTQDYDIQLPPEESRLVVECYLEDGQPMRLLLSESTALLDTGLVPPVFIDAVVTITHRGRVDTLRPFVYIDLERRRGYNYGNPTIVQADYTSGEPYRIDVMDSKGRRAYGVTQFVRPVEITSLTPSFDNEGEAFCTSRFPDDPSTKNYYRLVLTKNAPYDTVEQDQLFDETFVNNDGDIVFGSGYDYARGDTIHGALYHLTYDYYRYLTTSQNARGALVNPFAVSGEVVSNIEGGIGVFAALSVTRKVVAVE